MFVIASNISTRIPRVKSIFQRAERAGWAATGEAASMLGELARQCVASGADALEINTQQHYGRPQAMEFAVRIAQKAAGARLCLSSNNYEALVAGLSTSKRPPLVNYLSLEEARLGDMLPLIASHHAGVVLLVSEPSAPTDAREMLHKTAILVGAANEAGIPSDDILVDPGLIHVTRDAGQRHLVEVAAFLRALPDATEPPVKSTCWLASASAGAPPRLRPALETALLALLAGAGLSSVFLDVLRRENRRAVRLTKIFGNEVVYSDSDLELI